MPEYVVTDPQSGKKVRLTGDSPPSERELEEIFSSIPQERPQVQGVFPPGTSYMDRVKQGFLGTPEVGAAYGAAKPLIGAVQLGAMAGEALLGQEGDGRMSARIGRGLESFENARERAVGTASGSSLPEAAGQMITGGALFSKIKPASGFIMRAMQGAGIGGAMGALEPVSGDDGMGAQKAAQTATGAVVGGATSLAGSALRTAYERLFRGGREIAAGRAANAAAGDRQPAVMQELNANQNPISQGTAGQVAAPAGSAEFSALQRQAANVRPSEYEAIRKVQDAARLGSVQSIGGTADDLTAATTARSASAGPLYRAAENSTAKPSTERAVRLIDRILTKRSNEAAFAPLNQIKETITRSSSAPDLISASRNIQNIMSQKGPTGAPANEAIVRELKTVKRALDQSIAKAVPEYGQAQALFRDMSKPIDRMKVGQYIEEKLVPSLNDVGASAPQRAQVFATAMRDMDDSVAKATGFKRGGGIGALMTPDEMQQLRAVGSDLARDADFERLSRAGARKANDVVRDMFAGTGINPLSRPMMVINAILRRTGAQASERTLDLLAEKMQNPQAMAEIMQKAAVAERRQIERGIMLYLTGGGASSAADATSWAQKVAKKGLNSVSNEEQ